LQASVHQSNKFVKENDLSPLEMLWWLIVGHFVADYTFQSDFVAKFKSRTNSLTAVPWYYVLTSHVLTHSAMVGVLTGSAWISVAEAVVHFGLDFAKCEGRTNIHVDQAGHILCKVLWVVVLFA
jgi:hypothetical protein